MITQDFVDKFSAQKLGNESALGFVSQSDDFVASTVVDIGTSLWNSIIAVPKLLGINTDEYRVDTYDVLKSVNEDWANYYAESKDAVEMASFIGGLLLPAGAAMKGMKILQAGKLGFYPTFLNEGTQAARISELQKMLELGGKSTVEYRNLRWKILATNAGQETLQNAGAELAIIGTMNQHAYMEDYLKDPIKNIAIGLTIGGVIGSGLGQIAIRKTLAESLGSTATEALGKVQSKLVDIPLGISDVDKVQRFSVNAQILHGIAEDTTQTPLTRDIAIDFARMWEGRAGQLEQTSVFGTALKGLKDIEAKKQAREIMLSDAAYGANRVELTTFDDREFMLRKRPGKEFFTDEAEKVAGIKFDRLAEYSRETRASLISSSGLERLKPDWEELMKNVYKISYSPFHKAWIPVSQIANYSRAVDTGATQWEKIPAILRPNPDAFAEFATREVPTAKADKYWINTLGSVDNAALEYKVFIANGDLGVQNAWLSRIAILTEDNKFLPAIYLVPDVTGEVTIGQIKKQGRLVSISELEEHLASKKTQLVKEMVTQGSSIQEIGIRLNVSSSAIERMLMTGEALAQQDGWRLYTSARSIEENYLSQKGRMLDFTTNGKRVASLYNRNADMSARLDSKFIREQNLGIMVDIIAGSKSAIIKQLYEVLDADRRTWDIFDEQLANIVNEKAGSFFFTSADFASRRMGDIGHIASVKGQELFGVFNNVSQRELTPLATKTREILTTQAGLNEFNETINILTSTSGYRNIDEVTGQLYRLVEQEPGTFVRSPIYKPNGGLLKPSDAVLSWIKEMKRVGGELFQFKNTVNKIQGFKELNDIGLWIPTFNPANKFISYVIDNQAAEGASRVKLLAGKSPEELASLERNWKSQSGNDARYSLVTKAEQEDYNFWQMRQDPIEMDFADITKFHSGASGLAITPMDDTFATTVIENLHNRIIHYGRKLQEMYLSDIMTQLDDMSALNQKYIGNQPILAGKIGLAQREDAARAIKNVLLGNSQLGNYSTWKTINNGFTSMVEWGSRKTQELYKGLLSKEVGERDFVKMQKELGNMGIASPFGNFNEFQLANAERIEAAKRISIVPADMKGDIRVFAPGKPFDLLKDGKVVGRAYVEQVGTDLKIHDIAATGGKGAFGLKTLQEFGTSLKELFPGIETVSGLRVTGMREAKFMKSIEEIKDLVNKKIITQEEADIRIEKFTTTAPLSFVDFSVVERRKEAARMDSLLVGALARKNNISSASAEQIIATGNSVLATLALRVLETGHAFVTAVSWPIMTLPELLTKMPKTFMGNAATGEAIEAMFPARAIYDGIRWRHSDAAKPHIERWIKEGFGKPIVSEATDLNQMLSSGAQGIVGKINKIVNSDFIKTLSTPSDFAEKETRLWSLSVGYQIARRLYPGISDEGADLFAKQFLTKTVGNYYAAQRPAMFQGTFGVAIGLFQTYMLSWAQQMYRGIEDRQFKALASQMLSQAGLFGMSSLPMYDMFSKTIGEHFSDKHYDLSTGTYRALPDQAAEFLIYGLPASLGVGVYTRGDLQPRLPFVGQQNPLDTIAAINASRQFIGATGHSLSKVYEANGLGDRFRGLLEGISMQSLSRPLARIVETVPLPDGKGGFRAVGAISREGNTIATSEEIWSGPGLMSRLLTSRAAEEQVKREVDYLNSFYGAVDYKNRKKATEALKSSIRSGTLDDATLENTSREYLRTGTSTGWTAALNEALATSEGGIDYKLGKRLRSGSPLQLMIQENY